MYKNHQVLNYTDDVTMIVENENELKKTMKRLMEVAHWVGQKLNQKKHKVTRIGETQDDRKNFK